MIRLFRNASNLLLSLGMLCPLNLAAASTELDAEAAFRDFKNFSQTIPPCSSMHCHLIWAAEAMALSDLGTYSRRLKISGMPSYAESVGIVQDFKLLALLEGMPQTEGNHFDKNFRIQIKNNSAWAKNSASKSDTGGDIRPIIEIHINAVPLDVILDTGAVLNVPTGSDAARTLEFVPVPIRGPSALGDVIQSGLAVGKKINIGAIQIKNLTARVNSIFSIPNNGLAGPPIGQIGADLLLRFNAVTVDMKSGIIEFNPKKIRNANCSPMELALDKNMLPAGIVSKILIDGELLRARIDTGFNGDILVHGAQHLKESKFSPTNALAFDDSGKTSNSLEVGEVTAMIGKSKSKHIAFRTSADDPVVNAILGIKFFANRSFTFNFKKSVFCVD